MTDQHYPAVEQRLRSLWQKGIRDYYQVLQNAQGADPCLVQQILESFAEKEPDIDPRPDGLRNNSGKVFESLPAADPINGQWWFTLDTLDWIADHIAGTIEVDNDNRKAICIGACTIAHRLAQMGWSVLAIDIDPHLATVFDGLPNCEFRAQSVSKPLKEEDFQSYRIAIGDPPWYAPYFQAFTTQLWRALRPEGELLLTYPPRLTRPKVSEERHKLVTTLINAGGQLLAVENDRIRYTVPHFEEQALSNVPGFGAAPWRTGDLLQFRKDMNAEELDMPCMTDEKFHQSFARDPFKYRVFFAGTASSSRHPIRLDKEFSQTISRRTKHGPIDIWDSEKRGFQVNSVEEADGVLKMWSNGSSIDQTIKSLEEAGICEAAEVVRDYDKELELWSRFSTTSFEPENKRSEFAASPSGREHSSDKRDGFRSQFSRDRDRIIWSTHFRKLSNKTQLFPVEYDDQLRQRLAHSLEVMQLAQTIGASLGLDESLIEAGALAHDIGHTPFGHAGEHALDKLMKDIDSGSPGFNHYEHGVDVVRYLEDAYQSVQNDGHDGLDLTSDVCECIFKHTFCHNGTGFSHEQIRKTSKHRDFLEDGYCHLEGQAVRVADKISYLVSDIEDGIRLGIITELDLRQCRLFHRAPIDLGGRENQFLSLWFRTQRRNVLKVLMEDIIMSSRHNLDLLKTLKDVRQSNKYQIDHSEQIKSDIGQIWHRLQVGRLHKDARVVRSNMRAARVVSELTLLFAVKPSMIDDEFQNRYTSLIYSPYMKHYCRPNDTQDIPPNLLSFLPLGVLIGEKGGPGVTTQP